MSLPLIAIVGRPNVGKSTLFNRLIGVRYAITSDVPGTTRDRIYHEAEIGGFHTILVDTGGMEFEKKLDIEADVQLQARVAVEEADLIYFVLDATEPLTASDFDCAAFLRKSGKPVILVAHKADSKKSEEGMREFLELGLAEPILVSSIHNLGISELNDATKKALKKLNWKKKPSRKSSAIKIAITGKSNVGKSSLVNALLGENRLIVSEKPGTTIDATDSPFRTGGQDFVLIDTAGIRRRGKVRMGLERLGTLRALRAISRADIACIVLDWSSGIANQDLHVSQYVLDAGKGLMIVVNKSDLMENPDRDRKDFLDRLHYRMAFIPWAPVLFTSNVARKNIFQIFELAKHIAEARRKKIPDALFRTFVQTTVLAHPPSRSGHRIIFEKAAQTGINPPEFTFTVNAPDQVHFSYRRFLENEIRRKFGFDGTAMRLEFVRR